MKEIEKNTFTILGQTYQFKLSLLNPDQKGLGKMGGELSNSATYPSSYRNVHKDEVGNMNGSFTMDMSEEGRRRCKWVRCVYSKKLSDVN